LDAVVTGTAVVVLTAVVVTGCVVAAEVVVVDVALELQPVITNAHTNRITRGTSTFFMCYLLVILLVCAFVITGGGRMVSTGKEGSRRHAGVLSARYQMEINTNAEPELALAA